MKPTFERAFFMPDMPRNSHLQKRINQLTREKREAIARINRLIREKEEAIARADDTGWLEAGSIMFLDNSSGSRLQVVVKKIHEYE
ncbi:MAG: hypothetical protein V3T61_03690, partial [Acidobacteriota bacterium]